MKFSKFFTFLIVIAFHSSVFGQSSTILFEGFNNNNNKWPTYNNDNAYLNVSGGDYIINHKRESGAYTGTIYKYINKTRDFRISANIKKQSGTQTGGYGLVFGRQNSSNQNYFLITGNGSYRISKSKGGSLSVIKDWTKSSKIKTGNSATNTITVKQVSKKLEFYINSSLVYTHYSPEYFGNNVGFYVSNRQKIAVAYLSLSYQDKKTTTKKKTTTQSKSILFDGFNSSSNPNGWSTKKSAEVDLSIVNGDYIFDHKRDSKGWVSTINKYIDTSRDFRIAASIKKVSGIQNNGYGLIFGRKDNDNENHFMISGDGSFKIMNYENGTTNKIKDWTKSSAIKTGNGASNYLKVQKAGNTYKFYINSTLVYTRYTPFKFYGNRTGFVVYDRQKISVAYISLDYDGVKKTNTNTNYSSKTILFEGFNNNNNNWPTSSDNEVTVKISGGDYIIDHKRNSKGGIGLLYKYFDTSRDFRIAAQFKKISGIQNNGYGLVFGRKDDNNQNIFLISGNGQFQIAKFKNGSRTNIKNWTSSSKIKTGNGGRNYLTVLKKGNRIDYMINSSIVHTSYSPEFFGYNTGFVAYQRQKIAIEYLSMSYQDSKTNVVDNKKKNNNNHYTKESIIFDGYTSNKNGWAIDNSSNAKLEIKNGDYFFEHKRKSGGWTTTINQYIDTSRDFKIEALINKISGEQYNGYGLTFTRKDASNQNLFYINANGAYSVNSMSNGSNNLKQKWVTSSAIRKGNGVYNILKVVKIGNKLEYYINNNKVYTDYNPKFYGNRLGYVLYDDQKISIGYISAGYLDKKKASNDLVTNFSRDNVSKKNYSDDYNYAFSDQFNSNKNSWQVMNDNDVAYKITNGKYYLLHKKKTGAYRVDISRNIDTKRDFEIETKIDKIAGETNSTYGLLFGGSGQNQFRYHITSTGYYQIKRLVNNKYQDIVKWTQSSYLNKGNQSSNTLKIKKEGQHLKFYINDKYVNEIDFEPFYGNEIGYFLQSNQEIAVDFLRFKYLQKKNVVTYSKLTAPLFDGFNSNTNNWHIEDSEKYSSKVVAGNLVLDRKQSGGTFLSKDLDLNTSKNFIIKASISTDKYGGDGMYGITFGRKNSSNEYSFLISPNGSYKFRKFENDKYKSIIPLTSSKSIKTGTGQQNEIKIVKSGNLLRFYVNNQYLNETRFERFFGNKFGFTVYHSQRIKVDYLDINYKTQTFNEPPVVVITEPNVELKRGFTIVKAKKITVKGKATDKDGIYEVKINGTDAYIKDDGTFTANVPLKVGSNELIVTATDLKQASSTKTFVIRRQSPVIKDDDIIVVDDNDDKDLNIGFGEYHALLIGVSDYNNENIPDLAGAPINDANKLSNILITKYNFKKDNVVMLTNSPKKNDILKAMYDLRKKVKKNDNVIIFYAGHGNWSEEEDRGWWMPSDYIPEYEGNSIGNAEIVKQIELIKSKHTLLISDACFSGGVFKETRSGKIASKSITKKYSLTSRRAMTSGNLKEVPNESVFLKFLIKRLTENQKNYLPASRLFISLEDAVINNTDNTPRYGPIFGAGDEGGDFIFVKN